MLFIPYDGEFEKACTIDELQFTFTKLCHREVKFKIEEHPNERRAANGENASTKFNSHLIR